MNYDSKHTKILNPKEGYNLISKEYKQYHKHLDSFEKWFFLNLLPPDTSSFDVIDIWAWDWRIYNILQTRNHKFNSYTAFDISEKLLSKHPGGVNKIIWDLEETLPFPDNSFDLIFSFFVLEHIDDIDHLFFEIERTLKPWAQVIIWHFIQRREFTRKKWNENFRIKFFNHRIQDLEKIAKKNLLNTRIIPIQEWRDLLWHIIICTK